jgi:hypothetical protein
MQTYRLLDNEFKLIKEVKGLVNALKESKKYKEVNGQYAVIAKKYN